MTQPPEHVLAAARDRTAARQARDFSTADSLRDTIAEHGWLVTDTPEGFVLTPKPAFEVAQRVTDLPDRSASPDTRSCAVLVLVTGWAEDLRGCCDNLISHLPDDVPIVAMDLGNVADAGAALHAIAQERPGRIEEWHVAPPIEQVGFGPAMNALRHLDTSTVQVVAETSTLLYDDAVTTMVERLRDDVTLGAVGWRGVNVNPNNEWRSFEAAPAGEVDALEGYLIAFRRSALEDVQGYSPKARFYRNADLEVSLRLRAGGWRLEALDDTLPVMQTRHRGYHDTDAAYRDRESRRTYDRILATYRGRDDILASRTAAPGSDA